MEARNGADCVKFQRAMQGVVPGHKALFGRVLHRVTWITRERVSAALVGEGNFNRGSEMAETRYKVNIKVTTASDTIEVFLRKGNSSEPLPKAKGHSGQDKKLVAGDYSVWIFGNPVPDNITAKIVISRKGSEAKEHEETSVDALIIADLPFRIRTDGSMI